MVTFFCFYANTAQRSLLPGVNGIMTSSNVVFCKVEIRGEGMEMEKKEVGKMDYYNFVIKYGLSRFSKINKI